MVTLHPLVHGGILADPDDPDHQRDLEDHGIEPISLVVAGLYPFHVDPGVELIDIGGPAMVRAAAKNHAHVGVLVDPGDYEPVLEELRTGGRLSAGRGVGWRAGPSRSPPPTTQRSSSGSIGPAPTNRPRRRRELLLPARLYDSTWSGPRTCGTGRTRTRWRPATGSGGTSGWWDKAVQHGGKALSYLNLFDTEAAWRLVHRFDRPACVIVKHANPCGVAVDDVDDITTAYERAHACDPVSAFGGIVALNREVTEELARSLASVFTEVVVAPGYDEAALAVLTAKANLRVLTAPSPGHAGARRPARGRRPARAATGPGRRGSQRVVGRDGP